MALFTWEAQDYQVSLRRLNAEDSNSDRANRRDHQNFPMPEATERLKIKRRFEPAECQMLKAGFIPQSMDDKWFTFFDGNTERLNFHRSWTGFCIFAVKLQDSRGGCEIREALCNRDTMQYQSSSAANDLEVLNWLIDDLLLGNERLFPDTQM